MQKIFRYLTVPLLVAAVGCQGLTPHTVERDVTGAYDVESRYKLEKFEGVFTGLAGKWSEPDRAIGTQIQADVRSRFGTTAGDAFVSIYGAKLQSDITAYMNEEAPPWVMNLKSSLEGVDKQLATIDMQQAWLIAEKEDLNGLEATQIFNGVAVFADPDCRGSGALTCDQIEVNSESLLNAEYPIEILSSRYDVVDNSDSISLNSNQVNFNYGRLGLYYLTNLILPDDPDEGLTLRDVALGAINCRGLASRLTGDDGVYNVGIPGVGIQLNDLIGSCQDGVFGTVNKFVDGFSAPMKMDLNGTSKTFDVNRDGRVDQITGGTVDGDMNVELFSGQLQEGLVSGFFDGFRVGEN